MNGIQMYYEPKVLSQLEFRHGQKTDGRKTYHEMFFMRDEMPFRKELIFGIEKSSKCARTEASMGQEDSV